MRLVGGGVGVGQCRDQNRERVVGKGGAQGLRHVEGHEGSHQLILRGSRAAQRPVLEDKGRGQPLLWGERGRGRGSVGWGWSGLCPPSPACQTLAFVCQNSRRWLSHVGTAHIVPEVPAFCLFNRKHFLFKTWWRSRDVFLFQTYPRGKPRWYFRDISRLF